MIIRPKAPNNTAKCEHVNIKRQAGCEQEPEAAGSLVDGLLAGEAVPLPQRGATAVQKCRSPSWEWAVIHTPVGEGSPSG